MNKATMQQLADAAGVSRVTVWKALTGRPGVSEKLRRQVQRAAEEMSSLSPARGGGSLPRRTFSIVVARPETATFWMRIIHHAAQELDSHGINLMYIYMPAAWQPGYALPSSLRPGATDGFIALNIYDEKLLRLLAERPLPKVFLDCTPHFSPEELRGSLVLLEGRRSVRAITERLLERGCRRIGFIGDNFYAQIYLDRFAGFEEALARVGLKPDPDLCLTGPIPLHGLRSRVTGFLSGLADWPEAIVCACDYMAELVRDYMKGCGREFDERFILTGFDNTPEYPGVAGSITTVNVAEAELGRSLARKLMFHADYPDAPQELSYVSTRVLFRGRLG